MSNGNLRHIGISKSEEIRPSPPNLPVSIVDKIDHKRGCMAHLMRQRISETLRRGANLARYVNLASANTKSRLVPAITSRRAQASIPRELHVARKLLLKHFGVELVVEHFEKLFFDLLETESLNVVFHWWISAFLVWNYCRERLDEWEGFFQRLSVLSHALRGFYQSLVS